MGLERQLKFALSRTNRRVVVGIVMSLLFLLWMVQGSSPPSTSRCRPKEIVVPISIAELEAGGQASRLLITGGAGYIAGHMALLFLTSHIKHEITLVDDLSRGNRQNLNRLQKIAADNGQKLSFIEADVGDEDVMARVLQDSRIDTVIHFAGFAYASESVQEPLKYFKNIVEGTRSLLSAMQTAGVNRLIYSSSSATYGKIIDEECDVPLTERSPQNPVSPYGVSKLQSEQMILAYATAQRLAGDPFSYAMLRYFNVIGADMEGRLGPLPKPTLQKFGRIVDACFDAAENRTPMKVFGNDYATKDGSAVRDYIHVSDLVSAHKVVIQAVRSGERSAVYNIGINSGASCLELVEACSRATGTKVEIQHFPRREGDPPTVIGDPSRIMMELGWKPRYTNLTANVGSAWRWRKAHGDEAR